MDSLPPSLWLLELWQYYLQTLHLRIELPLNLFLFSVPSLLLSDGGLPLFTSISGGPNLRQSLSSQKIRSVMGFIMTSYAALYFSIVYASWTYDSGSCLSLRIHLIACLQGIPEISHTLQSQQLKLRFTLTWVFPSTTSNNPLPVGIIIHILLCISVSLSRIVTRGHNFPLHPFTISNFPTIVLINFFLIAPNNVNTGLYLNFSILSLKDSTKLVVLSGHLVSV